MRSSLERCCPAAACTSANSLRCSRECRQKLGSTTRGIVPPAFVSALCKVELQIRPRYRSAIRHRVLQGHFRCCAPIVYERRHEPVRPGVVVVVLWSLAQWVVRIGIGVRARDLDIDVQVLPSRRVVREIAGRPAAVVEDDVVQVPRSAAVRQIDRQRRRHRGGRQCAGRDVRDDLLRDKSRRGWKTRH